MIYQFIEVSHSRYIIWYILFDYMAVTESHKQVTHYIMIAIQLQNVSHIREYMINSTMGRWKMLI